MNVCYTALVAITAKCITFNAPFRQWPKWQNKTSFFLLFLFVLLFCFVFFVPPQTATFLMSISLYDGKYRSVS